MGKKSLEIDMIAGSQLRDTQGETLSVEGADISDLELGKGRLNDNHGKGFFNSIGAITTAKKIFKKEDCEDERHRYYWEKVKAPFIYVKGYLYDNEDHPNARAAAAILRNIHKNDTPLQLKASVEGGVVARGVSDNTLLARTKIHSVALTFTPANKNTLVEPLSLDKSISYQEDEQLIKSVMHLAQTNVPSFRHIVRDAVAEKILKKLETISSLSSQLNIESNLPFLSKNDIIEKSIEDKIKNNIELIHTIIVEQDELDKGIARNVAAAAGMGAALLGGLGGVEEANANAKAKQPVASVIRNSDSTPHVKVFNRIKEQYPILGAIGMQESTGGLRGGLHSTIKDPKDKINYGHTAGGIWGMMPAHASFIISKDPELAKKYPKLAEEAKKIKSNNFNHLLFTNTFNTDPEAAADFAISAYKRHKEKTNSDDMLIASWKAGINGAWRIYNKNKHLDSDHFGKHQYTRDVKQKLAQIQADQSRNIATANIKKALMAGYGGASAPMSRVGGAVLQSERFEPKSLKYITCDECGKEQVYSKYQVKCRECNKNFSLKKLNSILS
jgi:hypothetical protein